MSIVSPLRPSPIERPDGRRRAAATPHLVGRDAEIARLLDALGGPSTVAVVLIHGIAGIGKSSLLEAWQPEAERRGIRVVRLDARTIEPTEIGFMTALGDAIGVIARGPDDLPERLASRPTVIALDNAEVLRLLDTWLRQDFVPSLPAGVRLVCAGREPPLAAWLTSATLEGRVAVVPLGPIGEAEALTLLGRLGVPGARARELARLARGHPLALRLAAATLAERPDLGLDDLAAHGVVDELVRLHLADVRDPGIRAALGAASTVRRLTLTLLRAMVPDASSVAYDGLAALPFVESRHDGLVVHDVVRDAIARHLRAADPSAYRRYRRTAWRRLSVEVASAPSSDLWRYTADMLYLIENPVVREAFFPSAAQPLAVEPAPSDARDAIEAIARRHDGADSAALVRAWWASARPTFAVVRDRDANVIAYSQLIDPATLRSTAVAEDAVVAGWRRHLRDMPVARGQQVLGFRRWLDLDLGEAPGASQAASWLDVKRTYMAMRPRLARIYTVVRDAATYWPVVERLGFRLLPERDRVASIGGQDYVSVALDFGPRSVDGWLAGLVATELGVVPWELDEADRELRFDGRRVSLTPLEFGVLDVLRRIPGRTVSRRVLLEDVWGWQVSGASNVVDAVVRRLRDKVEGAVVIETVRGRGYRLREDD